VAQDLAGVRVCEPTAPARMHIQFGSAFGFASIHVAAAIGVVLAPITTRLFVLALIAYLVRTVAINAAYHRYLSHHGFRTTRAFQFILAALGTLALQKGPLWWAAHHRKHHRFSDTGLDVHSASRQGFFTAYAGWILDSANDPTDYSVIRDLTRYPELMWLNRYHLVPPTVVGAAIWLIWGMPVFVWVCLVAVVAQWHVLFTSNVLCHVIGSQRFDTSDNSRNNALFGILLMGEGWHNNHHHYPSSARQGFFWWELDLTYFVLRMLKTVGIVWDLREVPERVLLARRPEKGT